jgi:hypothetical protein
LYLEEKEERQEEESSKCKEPCQYYEWYLQHCHYEEIGSTDDVVVDMDGGIWCTYFAGGEQRRMKLDFFHLK